MVAEQTDPAPPKRFWRTFSDILPPRDDKAAFWESLAIAAFTIGTLTIVTFSAPFNSGWLQRSGLMFAIAIGAWMGGGALGFLFGVPRFKSTSATQNPLTMNANTNATIGFIPNTNLEQISDWLTKIIIGATLVQLGPLKEEIGNLCDNVGIALGNKQAGIFCGGIVVFFFFSGFLWGYLWCSIRIFREMERLTEKVKNS